MQTEGAVLRERWWANGSRTRSARRANIGTALQPRSTACDIERSLADARGRGHVAAVDVTDPSHVVTRGSAISVGGNVRLAPFVCDFELKRAGWRDAIFVL